MSAQSIMFQGTASDAGKSWLVAAVCRILSNQGKKLFHLNHRTWR